MSYVELYFHIVWATRRRQHLLMEEIEEAVYRCILKEAQAQGYSVLAVNGTPNHVHLLLQSGPQLDLYALMRQLKGVTSLMVNKMPDFHERFRWQEGYFAITVTPSHLSKVLDYIQNQKEHDRNGTTYSLWERTGDETKD